ncbi:hypothetical protein PZ897_17535 [Hoeflea sp. YIM 152468]|uniref:hypothetical protein n=1 Tax=Hoeflea sp. YIM 152468 TaxID=3031759 RepID=UPI0023DACF7D|nr:hypothetical protein [Hoeflea sp. YIM 152468]MDF1609986.1 hypothetical protein [Hoeflea sp. YIM 152468]
MTRISTQLLREGDVVAEVEVILHNGDHDWTPTVDLGSIRKLDSVRRALRAGDVRTAAKNARLYRRVKDDLAQEFAEPPQPDLKL